LLLLNSIRSIGEGNVIASSTQRAWSASVGQDAILSLQILPKKQRNYS